MGDIRGFHVGIRGRVPITFSMAHRILIVDDDEEFNVLLTDVFAQAEYDIETCTNAGSALARLDQGGIDLLVTDFRMPGPNGLHLIKQVRDSDPDLPIIMVSGFLENGMIRDLIRYGVGGIFMKPLNIFSLLKKTEELIERENAREAQQLGTPSFGYGANVGFTFRAFPCRDPNSREFAKRLYELRDFAKNILLIAEKGTDLQTICEDLVATSERCPKVVFFAPEEFERASAMAALAGEGIDCALGFTFVFERAERLTLEQRSLIFEIAHYERSFANDTRPRRFIFCLDRDLDDYYDEGLIDEEFYLFLGTTELKVPSLRDIPEDLPIIADTILNRECAGKELEGAARAFLPRHDWTGNIIGFAEKLCLAARLSSTSSVTVSDLHQAIEGPVEDPLASGDDENSPLEAFLRQRRDDYVTAFQRLMGRWPTTRGASPEPVRAS